MPNYANGKICYIEMPATDIARSADFYKKIFGWNIRKRGDNVAATVDAIVANGGEIVQPVGADAPEITARFRDPGGNVIGLYQQRLVWNILCAPPALPSRDEVEEWLRNRTDCSGYLTAKSRYPRQE
jgi:uncharacterized protein